ncbi:MAG: FG-GAP-like repeat-containing protein, partial [Bacteroidota bacterium]
IVVEVDKDGMKDLFVSNGIPKRMNDMDYINFMANDDIQWRIRTKNMEEGDLGVIEKMPEIKLPNKFFRNAGQYRFQDLASTVENNLQTYSNGAIYADLDNDGDLDIVVNNIDAPASVYENLHQAEKRDHMSLVLHGSPTNRNAIGARVLVYSGEEVRLYEKYPVKGFQSSMEIPLHIGLGSTPIDSIFLIWPDRSYQQLDPTALDQELYYPMDIPAFDFARLHQKEDHGFQAADITESTGIVFQHEENPFVEFNREPLIPHMTSAEGPALAVGDINGDGLDDVFIGGAKRTQSAVFVQGEGGYFQELPQPALEADSVFEDVDAVFADVNKDGHADLLIASGGNEYFYKERYLFPRVYLNDGNGRFQAKPDAFDSLLITASCILPYDFTGDGHLDLFIGGRAVSWAYGEAAPSFLLVNDGTGKFTDETASRAKELVKVGLVKNASWGDLDGDQDQDLMLAMEWDEILAFENKNGKFSKVSLSNGKKGWWNFVEPVDVDGDGDLDLLAGNLGLNARLKASDKEPIRMYFNDFDGNGRREQILTYYLQGREIPFANKVEMEKQLPDVKRKFLFAADFAKAKVEDIVDLKKLKEGETLEANYFSNALLINDGNWNFTLKALPYDAQHTPLKDALVRDVNKDGHPDLIVGGNFYENNIQMGRYDADYGSVLLNDGAGNFSRVSLGEVIIKGQTRQIKPISIGGVESVIFARNNATPVIVNLR